MSGKALSPQVKRTASRPAPAQVAARAVPQAVPQVVPQAVPQASSRAALQPPAETGLPAGLRSAVESLSGVSLEGVEVHYNSPRPGQIDALAYTQGSQIFLGPGQEKHLPHEAWHVVQQTRGRVRPTLFLQGGLQANHEPSLEHEAEHMGARAAQMQSRVQGHMPGASRAALQPAATGGVVQCVGGPKFGLQPTGDNANAVVQEGLDRLRAVQAAYKTAVRQAKAQARLTFEGGDMGDLARQQVYTQALAAAEMTPEGLFARLDQGLAHQGDAIQYQGVEIAQVRRGAAAYVQHQAADPATGTAAIFKLHTLDGPGAGEYVQVGGDMLRRYAYRGITPPERAALRAGTPLRPMNRGQETQGRMGFKFEDSGEAVEREHGPDKPTDLEWLNSKIDPHHQQAAVPANPQVLSFIQTRKGAGKLLSATSTPKPITSNAGASFAGFGRVRVDLARVPVVNIRHHYKQAPFTAAGVRQAGNLGPHAGALAWEVDRANETVKRNREIVLSEIPAAAVAHLEDTPDRAAYEAEFQARYIPRFNDGYEAAIQDADMNLGPAVPPAPATFPWREDHYTAMQARVDFLPAVAIANGRAAAAPRIQFGRAYLDAYKEAYERAFEDGAFQSPFYNALPLKRLQDFQPVVPKAPAVALIPPGVTAAAGSAAGNADGQADGNAAGLAYTE